MSDRKVTLDELKKRRGDSTFINSVKATGTIVIRDKDGNEKGKMKITSLEDKEDATGR
jgi:hypothetical protein